MKAASAKRVERALAEALATRLRGATSFAAAAADLETLRSLHVRTPSGALAKALEHLLTLLPFDSPQRPALLEEAEQAKAVAKEARSSGAENTAAPFALPPTAYETVPPRTDALALDPELVWHLPPAFSGDWTDETGTTAEDLVDRVRAAYPAEWGEGVAKGVRAVRRMALSCYPGFDAVEVLFQFESRALISQFVLLGQEIAFWVTGHAAGLHDLNARQGQDGKPYLDISNETNALEYLRFFCGAVHGDKGPFQIMQTSAELAAHLLPDAAYDIPNDTFAATPMTRLDGESSEAAWQTEAIVLYSNALFRSTFKINRNGFVEMIEDDPLAEDLPALSQGMVGGLRMLVGDH